MLFVILGLLARAQACLDGMQCFKVGLMPPSEPGADMYNEGPQFGGSGAPLQSVYSPPLFSQERFAPECVTKSPLMADYLRLLEAGVPAHLLWDEAHIVFFTTPEIAQSAGPVIKTIISSPDHVSSSLFLLFSSLFICLLGVLCPCVFFTLVCNSVGEPAVYFP